MALSQRSRVAIYAGLCKVVDEEAAEEFLSCFPVRDVEQPAPAGRIVQPIAGFGAAAAERLSRIEVRLTQLDARIETLATEMGAGLARIEQLIIDGSSPD